MDECKEEITHLIITTCTGFYAPGIDIQIIEHYNFNPAIERTIVGFMGCYAAINALKLARHIVNSEKSAHVLIVNIELCTLHLQNTNTVKDLLPLLIFADGCAASIVSAKKKWVLSYKVFIQPFFQVTVRKLRGILVILDLKYYFQAWCQN